MTASASRNAAPDAITLGTLATPTRLFPGSDGLTFSPIVSSLISGERDIIVVDPPLLAEDADALVDAVVRTGRNLTTIFITHAHGDHYFGMGRLIDRFPRAVAVAAPRVAAYIAEHRDRDVRRFQAMFGDGLAIPTSLPDALADLSIDLEGHALRVLDVGQGDIAASTALEIPDLGSFIVGDLAYNSIHVNLATSGPKQWDQWLESILALKRRKPRRVIAGHQKAGTSDEDIATILDGTYAYIRDFAAAVATHDAAEDIIAVMRAQYPTYGNLATLHVSAKAAISSTAQP